MRPRYWAVKPASGDEKAIRVARAESAEYAILETFGMTLYRSPDLKHLNLGRWLVKDLGTRVTVMHSNKQRLAALTSPEGWFDPAKGDKP
jgi:hypothetical protein